MNRDDKKDALDRNLTKMFPVGGDGITPEFEQRLLRAVGQQVQHQRRLRMQKRWFVRVSAAAAILIAAILIVPIHDEPIGTITDIRGLVILRNGGQLQAVAGERAVHPRQWIQTQSGTTADVVLSDRSRLTPHPRTALQLDRQKHGHTVRLEKGAVAIEAHKQPPGQYLRVETHGTAIRILGTRLDVRVVEKPTGIKQTHVHLHSGSVELASGGTSTLLLPGMVGIAEEGRAPLGISSVLEVNELRRLLQDTRTRAAQTKAHANMPTIIDYVNSTVWTVVPLDAFKEETPNVYSLRLKYPAFRVQAYTLDGAVAETRAEGRVLHADLSRRPPAAGAVSTIILRIPSATGLFRTADGKTREFIMPAASVPSVTLLQLALPKATTVQAVQGKIIDQIVETSERFGRLIVTLEADSQALQFYE
ncbi:MAG: FecR domain-containing protein [Phycisphaerales bacterium]|nr:MAG: FecR domain-containing protein [Phycisphaerales bacterium]